MTNAMCVVGAIDQGTVNTKFSLFDEKINLLTSSCINHQQIYPKQGWLEHNPMELYQNTLKMMSEATQELDRQYPDGYEVVAIGLSNQRETLVVWDKETGLPLCNAIVWLDMRTNELVHRLSTLHGGTEAFRNITGLPIASYFTGVKLLWVMEKYPEIAQQLRNKEALIGTVDSWLIWKLTGGPNGGVHVTDLTNASRTMLMDINSITWSTEMLRVFAPGMPKSCLPTIVSNAEVVGYLKGTGVQRLENVPISGVAGDQQADCVGHGIYNPGEVKATFGTGATVMMVTGPSIPVISQSGLLTTPLFRLTKKDPVMYALEGSVAIAGAALTWLKDNLGALMTREDAEELLESVQDNGDVYFCPAFAGLFAPRWRSDARGCIVGLTQYSTKAHIVRALFESIGFQLAEIFEALKKDSQEIPSFRENDDVVRIDGGLCQTVPSSAQIISDITGRIIAMRENVEVTSVGAAILAAFGIGLVDREKIKDLVKSFKTIRWEPKTVEEERIKLRSRWELTVERSLDWDDMETPEEIKHVRKYSDRLLSIDSVNDITLQPVRDAVQELSSDLLLLGTSKNLLN